MGCADRRRAKRASVRVVRIVSFFTVSYFRFKKIRGFKEIGQKQYQCSQITRISNTEKFSIYVKSAYENLESPFYFVFNLLPFFLKKVNEFTNFDPLFGVKCQEDKKNEFFDFFYLIIRQTTKELPTFGASKKYPKMGS